MLLTTRFVDYSNILFSIVMQRPAEMSPTYQKEPYLNSPDSLSSYNVTSPVYDKTPAAIPISRLCDKTLPLFPHPNSNKQPFYPGDFPTLAPKQDREGISPSHGIPPTCYSTVPGVLTPVSAKSKTVFFPSDDQLSDSLDCHGYNTERARNELYFSDYASPWDSITSPVPVSVIVLALFSLSKLAANWS